MSRNRWGKDRYEHYKRIREGMPLGKEQIQVILFLIDHYFLRKKKKLTNFLDMGCGDGFIGKKILLRYPDAHGCFLDFSKDRVKVAKQNLATCENTHVRHGDITKNNWTKKVCKPFDLIIAGYTIHFQPNGKKKEIYQDIYEILRPGGRVINLEHIKSPPPVEEEFSKLHDEFYVDSFLQHQINWGRNITREEAQEYYDKRPQKGGELLELDVQLDWLKEIGFEEVGSYMKIFSFVVFGGVKYQDMI